VYFSVYKINGKRIIAFACLKIEGHTLAWWESDVNGRSLGNEPLVIDWGVFKNIIKAQFYLIVGEED
jgi:hypothetical protein